MEEWLSRCRESSIAAVGASTDDSSDAEVAGSAVSAATGTHGSFLGGGGGLDVRVSFLVGLSRLVTRSDESRELAAWDLSPRACRLGCGRPPPDPDGGSSLRFKVVVATEGPEGLFSALSSSLSAVSSLNTASFRDRVRVLGLLAFGKTILLPQWGRMGQLGGRAAAFKDARGFPPPGNMSSHADMYCTLHTPWQGYHTSTAAADYHYSC